MDSMFRILCHVISIKTQQILYNIMKKLNRQQIYSLILISTVCIFFSACKKDEAPDVPLDDWSESNYSGTLEVVYKNSYPEWNVSTQMDVSIDGPLAYILIEGATLSYSGETLVSNDSKIKRSGSWVMNPVSHFEGDMDHPTIYINAQITIQNDIQQIYAKDNNGNWVLVNETDFSGETPYSELYFSFDDALLGNGSVVSDPTGSIIWTLRLVVDII